MSKYQEQRSYKKASADDAFSAAEQVFSKVGYQIVKKREIAWLIIARRETPDARAVSVNFSAQFGAQTTATLILNSDQMAEAELKTEAGRIFSALDPLLG